MKTSKVTLVVIGLGLCSLFFSTTAFPDGKADTSMNKKDMGSSMIADGTQKTVMIKPMEPGMVESTKSGMEQPMAAGMADSAKSGMENPMPGEKKPMN